MSFIVLVIFHLAGCDDLTDKGPMTDDDVHIEIPALSTSGSDCWGRSGHQDLDGLDFASYETYGESPSLAPPTSPSSLVETGRLSGGCEGDTYHRPSTAGDNTASWSTWTETWYANGSAYPEFLDCNVGCDPSGDNSGCNGDYYVKITNVSNCENYLPVKIFMDASSSSLIARREMDGAADCSSGSARFRLVPVQVGDVDNDGLIHYAFFPIQKTGTGVMTRSAWVTSIDQVSVPSGVTLRVIHTDKKFSFDLSDSLKNASTVSSVVNATNSYSTGVIDGNPVFVASEIAVGYLDDFEVDMAWSCGTSFTNTNSYQGYQFRLSDIGCLGSYNQKMTLRYASNPNRVSLEQYGTAAVSRTEPTQTTVEGKAFSFDRGHVSIDGVLLSHTAQQAQVKINYVKWNGVSICTAGTYTFAAE